MERRIQLEFQLKETQKELEAARVKEERAKQRLRGAQLGGD
jgi:hypothetical protein